MGVLSAVFGEVLDAIAIFVIIGLVASVEALTEARSRKALNALRTMIAPTARVRCDGSVLTIPAAEVVVGDVVVVEAGDVLTGDSRVLEAAGLAADESALTGEPVSAAKGRRGPSRPTLCWPNGPRCLVGVEHEPVRPGPQHLVERAFGDLERAIDDQALVGAERRLGTDQLAYLALGDLLAPVFHGGRGSPPVRFGCGRVAAGRSA